MVLCICFLYHYTSYVGFGSPSRRNIQELGKPVPCCAHNSRLFMSLSFQFNYSYYCWGLQAMSSIESEEDAEMALQLSSTLTQALLAYRIKNVSNVSAQDLVIIHY